MRLKVCEYLRFKAYVAEDRESMLRIKNRYDVVIEASGASKGIGLAFGRPIYVTAIDAATNRVTLAQQEALLHRRLPAREVNWLTGPANPVGPQVPLRVLAKVRYNSPPTAAAAWMTGPDELTVRFDEPVLAITPGQAVVCYEESTDRLLGGAWIDKVGA